MNIKLITAISLLAVMMFLFAGVNYLQDTGVLPVMVTSSGVWYRAGNMLKTNPPLPITTGRDYATTTEMAAPTLLASELNGYSSITIYASTSDVTLSLPATSTLATFIPNAGDQTEVIFKNSTTTAGIDLGLLPGTGMTFRKATSTATTTAEGMIRALFKRKTNTDMDVFIDVAI